MSSSVCFVAGGAMQCEWCHSSLANFKFADSNIENGTTKVVCAGCFHVLSLACIRQDLSLLNEKVTAIERQVGADLNQAG